MKDSIEYQELTKLAPASAHIERFDDVAAAVDARSSGRSQLLAAPARTAPDAGIARPFQFDL